MLGSGVQMVEQIQAGAIEAASCRPPGSRRLRRACRCSTCRSCSRAARSAYRVIDGPTGAAILEPLQKVNIDGRRILGERLQAVHRQLPDPQPADYQGHKIRTMPAPVIQEQFKAFGAMPTTIDFGELYSALQQKVVDGQENPDRHDRRDALLRGAEVPDAERSRLHRLRVHAQQAVPRQAAGRAARDPR